MHEADRRYRSRNFDPAASHRYIANLLKRLAEAEAKTDPKGEAVTEKGKDKEAFLALRTAGDLVDAVAGWAIDHVCGLSLSGELVLPLQPAKAKNHPEYLASRERADKHDHEARGSTVLREEFRTSAPDKRLLLRNFLFCGAGAGPDWLRDESARAFDALLHGETVPMLTPVVRKGDKVRFRELQSQLALIAIVRFRAKAYGGVARAFEFVAEKVGVSADTLRTWEKRLRDDLGLLEVSRTIEFATNAASYVSHATAKQSRGLALTDSERDNRAWHESRYGCEALDAAIAQYKAARAG